MGLLGQKAHRERPQPKKRQNLGILEKHKDYIVRATAYHSKQTTLQRLHRKAALRNEDEFYQAMNHTKFRKGRMIETKPKTGHLARDQADTKKKFLHYFDIVRNSERKKVDKMKETKILPFKGKRLIFEDSEEQPSIKQSQMEIDIQEDDDINSEQSDDDSDKEMRMHQRKAFEAEKKASTLRNHLISMEPGTKEIIKREGEEFNFDDEELDDNFGKISKRKRKEDRKSDSLKKMSGNKRMEHGVAFKFKQMRKR
ncbi:MAG: hypothetical protein EZS28_003645 [Streblomastix strix]|uniref:U3 small nucleolar RNA-associated protein 11 n=1 Tax=Streblomastix strix TaxID=222440 RepID=A0A5J4X0K4_9EUKA|nr:MAG: hypothetical protein EZS28_003645 [Streblomastix strix]